MRTEKEGYIYKLHWEILGNSNVDGNVRGYYF